MMNPYYSPIVGLEAMQQLHEQKCLGNYLLVLAHDILEHKSGYKEFFQQLHNDFQGKMFIIVDNSAIELGDALPAKYLSAAANIVNASCIVLPDILNNAEDTIKASIMGSRSLRHTSDLGDLSFMVVPQGDSIPQLHWCIQQLSLIPNVKYWGIPRSISNIFGSREVLKEILGYQHVGPSGPRIHMLGMSSNLFDDIWCTSYPNVMGIDSANPIVVGLKNVSIIDDINSYRHTSRPENYLSIGTLPEDSINNIRHIRNLLDEMCTARNKEKMTGSIRSNTYVSPPGHA